MFAEFRILVLFSALQAGLSYVTNIFLANKMGPDIFGQYSYVLVLGSVYTLFVTWGTAESGIRLRATYGDHVLSDILTLKVINFFIAGLSVLVSLVWDDSCLALLSLIAAMNALSYSTHYESKRLNVRFATVFLVERICMSVLFCVGVLFLDGGYITWLFSVMSLVQGASLFFQCLDNREFGLRVKRNSLMNIYRQGFFLMLFSLAKYSFGGITRLIIFQQLGDAKMGVFAAAWQFIPLSTIFFSQAIKAWRLKLTKSLDDRARSEFLRHLASLSLSVLAPAILACLTLTLIGAELIDILFSEKYVDARELIPYIGIYFIIVGLDTVVILLAVAVSAAHFASVIYLIFGSGTVVFCLVCPGTSLEFYALAIIVGHFLAVTASAHMVFRKVITRI